MLKACSVLAADSIARRTAALARVAGLRTVCGEQKERGARSREKRERERERERERKRVSDGTDKLVSLVSDALCKQMVSNHAPLAMCPKLLLSWFAWCCWC
jgi:hypothetical protein